MTEIESGYVEEICMKLKYGEYELVFDEGGVRIEKRGVGLYSICVYGPNFPISVLNLLRS